MVFSLWESVENDAANGRQPTFGLDLAWISHLTTLFKGEMSWLRIVADIQERLGQQLSMAGQGVLSRTFLFYFRADLELEKPPLDAQCVLSQWSVHTDLTSPDDQVDELRGDVTDLKAPIDAGENCEVLISRLKMALKGWPPGLMPAVI